LFTFEGADYLCKFMPHAEKIILNDCGHFMGIDKPEETTESIVNFFNRHSNYKEKQLTIIEFD
jgi:pimeloyl-ACP methyl ester carboxylesterase